MESSVPDYDSSVIMLTFSDDGIIGFLELDFAGSKMDTNGYSQIGKCEKKGTEYEISIISVGVSNATIKDGKLNAALFQADMYMELRKLETFNFYTEMYRK